MSDNYHVGDKVTQHGDGNVGIIKGRGIIDPQSAILELIAAVRALREDVPASDQAVIDTVMRTIGAGNEAEKGTMRRALSAIASIATVVGQVGVPVIESVRKVIEALGL